MSSKVTPCLETLSIFRWMHPTLLTSVSPQKGHQGLIHKATQAMRADVEEAFTEWISCSVHFVVNPIPIVDGWHHAVMASEWCRHQSWTEFQGQPVSNLASSKSDSTLLLVRSAPFICEDWPSRGHWDWTGCKGTFYPPVGKASQGLANKGGCG